MLIPMKHFLIPDRDVYILNDECKSAHERIFPMDELELIFEEKNVLQQQMFQMRELEDSLDLHPEMNQHRVEELKSNINSGEQRLWEIDRILEDCSRHKDNPDD